MEFGELINWLLSFYFEGSLLGIPIYFFSCFGDAIAHMFLIAHEAHVAVDRVIVVCVMEILQGPPVHGEARDRHFRLTRFHLHRFLEVI